jgi:hypothetical protein
LISSLPAPGRTSLRWIIDRVPFGGEGGEIGAFAEPGNAQFDRPGPGFPVAVALGRAGRPSARHGARRFWRQPRAPSAARRRNQSSREADPRQGSSPNARRFIISSVIAGSSVALRIATQPYRRIASDHRKLLPLSGSCRHRLVCLCSPPQSLANE